MGRVTWLLIALVVLLTMTCVRIHHYPGGMFGESISVEFVLPWR